MGRPEAAGTGGKAGGRGCQFYGGDKEASPARMSCTGAVPPITSGSATWPPFPAKLDHRGPMHETLAGLRALCTNKLNDKSYPHLPTPPLPCSPRSPRPPRLPSPFAPLYPLLVPSPSFPSP